MAKFKAWYAEEGEIPQFARDNNLYVSRNGRWEFDHAEFENLEDLTSPGLASNRDKFRQEKENAQNALTSEKARADKAEAELSKVQKPGTKIISDSEAQVFEEYKKLGAPKDLKKKVDEHGQLSEKLTRIEGEKDIRKLCEEAGLNFEAVNDLISSEKGSKLKLMSKKVKTKDAKGIETTSNQAYVTVEEDKGNGRFETKEYSLKDYADENLPKYLAKSIFDVEKSPEETSSKEKPTTRLPRLSGGSSKEGGEEETKSNADRFNASRNQRQLPWTKKSEAGS